MASGALPKQLKILEAILDEQAGRCKELNDGANVAEFLGRPRTREDEDEDEELLT